MQKLYIVRENDARTVLRAGDVVVELGAHENNMTEVHRKGQMMQPLMVPDACLLSMSRYLKCRATEDYWVLMLRRGLHDDVNRLVYLQDAAMETFGPVPFRFDSYGELVYYMLEHELLSYRFELGHFTYRADLITPNSKRLKNAKSRHISRRPSSTTGSSGA